jgi:transposase
MQRFERRSIRHDAPGTQRPNRNEREVSMNQDTAAKQAQQRCWGGVDWGGDEHVVSVATEARDVLATFRVGTTLSEHQRLVERLRACGPVAGIAIESTREPVINHLRAAGFTIYPINPKVSKNWRECNSVAGVKSDARDSIVLATELAGRHTTLRALDTHEPVAAELAGLCQKLRELIEQRTALVQRLKATLRQYYPGVLGFFTEWTSPAAWRFVKRFPRPETLARARKQTLIAFVKANRIGLHPVWVDRIDRRGEVTEWPAPPDRMSLEITAMATVAQLLALQPHIDKCDRLIAQRTRELPYARLIESLPGAGKRLAPALTAIIAVTAAEQNRIEALRCVSGVAPVQGDSGKRLRTTIRRRCNKHWRNVMHLFAHCSTLSCPWAKAFYTIHRKQGDTHACALRKLADKWLKIINRMLDTGQCYDDQRYVNTLRRRSSHVYLELCRNNCA